VTEYGKGKVAYLASTLESLFLGSNIRGLGDLIAALIRSLSSRAAPFELQAPDSLIANMTVKGNTRIVHLTNWTGNKYERRWVNEYYLAPVSNVVLTLPIAEGTVVTKVEALAEGSFESVIHENSIEIAIPRVEAYQAIAVTFSN